MPAVLESQTLVPHADLLQTVFEILPDDSLPFAMQLLSRVLRQTGDSVFITDAEGKISYVNPAFETTSGYSQAETLGKTPRILKSGLHDAEFYSELWSRLKEGQTSRGMVINRRKTRELYWSQQTITPMRDEAGRL